MSYFKIWYTTGSYEGNSFSDWQNLPVDGVLIVYERFSYDEFGNPIGQVYMGSDWYWMTPDGIVGQSPESADTPGEYAPCNPPPGAVIKQAKWTSNERMAEVSSELEQLMTNRYGP